MLEYLKKSVRLQLLFVLTASFAAGCAGWLTGFHPTVRLSFRYFLQGLGGGVFSSAIVLALTAIAGLFLGGREKSVPPSIARRHKVDRAGLAGRGFAAAGGEELILRGYIFAPLSLVSFWGSHLLNIFLGFILNIRRRDDLILAVIRSAEAALYAVFYTRTHSLFMVGVAHGIAEICVGAGFATQSYWTLLQHLREKRLALRYVKTIPVR